MYPGLIDSKPLNVSYSLMQKKRCSAIPLDREEMFLILILSLLDKNLFKSTLWPWRYSGMRYSPSVLPHRSLVESILVLQWPGALGDICMAVPFLSILRQLFPSAKIHVLTQQPYDRIYRVSGDVDLIIENPLDKHINMLMGGDSPSLSEVYADSKRLIAHLNENAYDLLINLQVVPVSAALSKLIGARFKIGMTLTDDGLPLLTGNTWVTYLFGVSANLFRSFNYFHRTDIFKFLIDPYQNLVPRPQITLTVSAMRNAQSFFDSNNIRDDDIVVGLIPLAGTPIRVWRHYGEVIRRASSRHNIKFIVFGTSSEEQQIRNMIVDAPNTVFATRLSIEELMAALIGCDLIISNDTGPMHLASLLKRPILAIFGPTSVYEVGPWGTSFTALQSPQCASCYCQQCMNPQDYCMDVIDVDSVLNELYRMLGLGQFFSPNPNKISRITDSTPSGSDEAAIKSFIFKYLSEKHCILGASIDNPPDFELEGKEILNSAFKLASLVKQGISLLHSPYLNYHQLRPIHHALLNQDNPLRLIVTINELITMDQRHGHFSNRDRLLAFYKSVEADLNLLFNSKSTKCP